MPIRILMCAAMGCLVAGCSGQVRGTSQSSTSWSSASEDATPGIDSGYAAVVTLMDGGLSTQFAVWADSDAVSGRGSSDSNGAVFTLTLPRPDGTETELVAAQADDGVIRITLDGREYAPADGALLLVSTSGDRIRGELLPITPDSVNRGMSNMTKFASSRPEIVEFFNAGAEVPPAEQESAEQ